MYIVWNEGTTLFAFILFCCHLIFWFQTRITPLLLFFCGLQSTRTWYMINFHIVGPFSWNIFLTLQEIFWHYRKISGRLNFSMHPSDLPDLILVLVIGRWGELWPWTGHGPLFPDCVFYWCFTYAIWSVVECVSTILVTSVTVLFKLSRML